MKNLGLNESGRLVTVAPVAKPRVVALAGLPGAGKTTIATQLSRRHGFTVISRDSTKRALFGRHDVGHEQNDIAFRAILEAVPVLISYSLAVVVDGMPFDRVGQMEDLERVVHGIRLIPILVDTPVDVAQRRLVPADKDGPSDRTPELVSQISASFRSIPETWHRLDGTLEASLNADRIASLHDGRGGPL